MLADALEEDHPNQAAEVREWNAATRRAMIAVPGTLRRSDRRGGTGDRAGPAVAADSRRRVDAVPVPTRRQDRQGTGPPGDELDPAFFFPVMVEGWADLDAGHYREALSALKRAKSLDAPAVDAIIATQPDPVAEMMRIRSAYHPDPNPSMDNCTAAQQIADTYRKRGDQNEAFIWFNTARVDCRRVGVVLR